MGSAAGEAAVLEAALEEGLKARLAMGSDANEVKREIQVSPSIQGWRGFLKPDGEEGCLVEFDGGWWRFGRV